MKIYCCGCKSSVEARLTNGREVYPHRIDLYKLPFWVCVMCGNYVGCHHKTKDKTRPLGVIPTPEIREARKCIHEIIDPLWKSGKISRKELYSKIENKLGYKYHSADIEDIKEAKIIIDIAKDIKSSI
jgi:hypothetical protein